MVYDFVIVLQSERIQNICLEKYTPSMGVTETVLLLNI